MEVGWKDLESIIDNYYQELYRYCYRMLRNKEDAEDILQDIFLKINIMLNSKKDIELHNSYIYKIAYNQLVEFFKTVVIDTFIKGWNKCGYIGSDYKVDVDKSRYKDLVRECFGKIDN